jgi:signal transduction histidine kinase
MNGNSPEPYASQKDLEPGPSVNKMRAVLLLAFGGLLTLMLIAGVNALLRMRELHVIEQQISRRFQTHSQALSTVVISVHIYDDQLTRLLLENESAEESQSHVEIADHAARAHSALRGYPSDGSPRERQFLQEIERELSEQESAASALLSLAPEDRKARSRRFVNEQFLPLSVNILQVSQQIALLNNEQLAHNSQDLLVQFESLRTKLKSMLLLTLIAGLLLSVTGSLYILRLERQGHTRYRALADSRRELENLSARLVDAQEQERRSIARELHDEVGQTLEALLVGVGGLPRYIPGEGQTIREQIQQLKSLAENAVKNVRDIALLLRPSMLDDLGLIPALEWQAREVSRRSKMEVDVHAEMIAEELPDEVKTCVYRLVQEALNNAAAHASAMRARVSVVRTPDKVRIEISDDGQGFNSQRVRGIGLLGMEERVKRLGGVLEIESQAGRGTTLIAELPLPSASSAS